MKFHPFFITAFGLYLVFCWDLDCVHIYMKKRSGINRRTGINRTTKKFKIQED